MLTITILFKANVRDTCIYTGKKKKPRFSLNLNKREPLAEVTDRQKWHKKRNCTEYAAFNYTQKSVNWKTAEKTKIPSLLCSCLFTLYVKRFGNFSSPF